MRNPAVRAASCAAPSSADFPLPDSRRAPGPARPWRASLALVVHDRPSGGRVSAGLVRTVSGGRLGLQVLVEFAKLAAHRCLVLQVLSVQPLDELVSWL